MNLKHGCRGRRGNGTPEYISWRQMRQRCNNPRATGYENYGGRGIRVCERWSSFAAFLADMGSRPIGHTLDRINVDGDYEPGNCRWSTVSVQQSNQHRQRIA